MHVNSYVFFLTSIEGPPKRSLLTSMVLQISPNAESRLRKQPHKCLPLMPDARLPRAAKGHVTSQESPFNPEARHSWWSQISDDHTDAGVAIGEHIPSSPIHFVRGKRHKSLQLRPLR